MPKPSIYKSESLGDLYFFPISARLGDEYDAVMEDDKLGTFQKLSRAIEILARNLDGTPRFADKDRDRLYDLPAGEVVDIARFGVDAAGCNADFTDVKKK